jgi:putative oxidoreductase
VTPDHHARRPLWRTLAWALLRPSLAAPGTDFVLLAVRVVVTWIFVYYGAGKLFGSFHGPGLGRTATYFASVAHLHPGMLFAVVGGIIEFGGALCVGLGLGTRLAGLALAGDQVMAMITVTWTNGINSLTNHPGYEFNMTLCVLSLVLVVLGAGRVSVDAAARRLFQGSRAGIGPS